MEEKGLYLKYCNGKHWDNHPTFYAQLFANFLRSKNFDGLLVDLGCGIGRDVNFFNERKINAKGIDLAKEIALAKDKFPKLDFEVQNIESLSFKDNSIGAYYMINVIHYLEKEKALNEIFRTLMPGGYFFIHFNLFIRDKKGEIDYTISEEDALKLLSKFDVIRKRVFERIDDEPIEHTHKVMELLLQKPIT